MTTQEILATLKKQAGEMFIYISHLLERPVFDANGRYAGKIYDIVVNSGPVYPVATALVIRKGFPNSVYAMVSWSDLEDIDAKGATLKIDKSKLSFAQRRDNKDEMTIRRDILDQQVVDTYNHKVIRVNDVHLLNVEHSFMLAHVDIGFRGIIRRLGFEKPLDAIVRMVDKNAKYLSLEHLISWKYIQSLSINPVSNTIKINVPQKLLGSIPAADMGEIFQDLNLKDQLALFRSLDVRSKAKVFANVDFKTQKLLFEEMDDRGAADVLNAVPADDATDFLEKIPKGEAERVLSLVETKYSKKLSQLLGYAHDVAGGLMTTEYIYFSKGTVVGDALKMIREREFKVEPQQFVFVVDAENHFVGTSSFRRLIMADPAEPVLSAIFPKSYYVQINSSLKEVAYLMEKYKYNVVPVVDEKNVLQGIITVDDILGHVITIAWRRMKRIKLQAKQ